MYQNSTTHCTRCKCPRGSLRITYRFRRGDPERISVKHIVGLGPNGDYLPMLWETFRHSSPRTPWIDFKYQRGRNPWGLTKRLVLEKVQFARLLRAYEHATGLAIMPLPNFGSSGRAEARRST